MDLKNVLFLGSGFALYMLGQKISGVGDAVPFAASGVSTQRLIYHGAALCLTLVALALFVAVGVRLFRAFRR